MVKEELGADAELLRQRPQRELLAADACNDLVGSPDEALPHGRRAAATRQPLAKASASPTSVRDALPAQLGRGTMAALTSGRPQIWRGPGKLDGKGLYEVHIEHNCMIVCPDGTELAGDIYRPCANVAPCPALITMLPYHKDAIGGVTSWDANHYFAERGYATVLIDFRGTGASGGAAPAAFRPG